MTTTPNKSTRLVKKLEPVFFDVEVLQVYKRFRRSVLRALAYLESRAPRDRKAFMSARELVEALISNLEAELKRSQCLLGSKMEAIKTNGKALKQPRTLNSHESAHIQDHVKTREEANTKEEDDKLALNASLEGVNDDKADLFTQGVTGADLKTEPHIEKSPHLNEHLRAEFAGGEIIMPVGNNVGVLHLSYASQIRYLYVLILTDRLFVAQRYASLCGVEIGMNAGVWRQRHRNRLVNLSAQVLSIAHKSRLAQENYEKPIL